MSAPFLRGLVVVGDAGLVDHEMRLRLDFILVGDDFGHRLVADRLAANIATGYSGSFRVVF
jgi:hypothetical protein